MQDGPKSGRRALAIFLALVAAAGLVVGAFGPKWLYDPLDDSSISPLGFDDCTSGQCKHMTNEELVDELDREIARIVEHNAKTTGNDMIAVPRAPWHGFPTMGWIALFSSLIAAASLVLAAVLALARRRIDWPVMPTTVGVLALIVAMVTGCVFVATKPDAIEGIGVGWTFGVFGAALVIGLGAVFPLNRQIRPIDEELGASSATMSWGASRDD